MSDKRMVAWIQVVPDDADDKCEEWMKWAGVTNDGDVYIPINLISLYGLSLMKLDRTHVLEHAGLTFVPIDRFIASADEEEERSDLETIKSSILDKYRRAMLDDPPAPT